MPSAFQPTSINTPDQHQSQTKLQSTLEIKSRQLYHMNIQALLSTSSFVLKMCLSRTAHPHLYRRCASFVLHTFACIAHPCLYCTFSLVLHILACTTHPHLYCTSSFVLLILARTAHSLYRAIKRVTGENLNLTLFLEYLKSKGKEVLEDGLVVTK